MCTHPVCNKIEGMRSVNIRQLRKNLASELEDVPFVICKNRIKIAVVIPIEESRELIKRGETISWEEFTDER